MFISNSRQFIYIHLHKCAGTSIERALATTQQWNDILLGSTGAGDKMTPPYRALFGLAKHSSASQVRQVVGGGVWSSYFTFSSVRNPYARAVSQYTYSMTHLRRARWHIGRRALASLKLKSGRMPGYEVKWPFYYPGVRALLETGGVNSRFSDFIRSDQHDHWPGFACQCAQLSDDQGNLIVDRVLKIEELASEWPRLCERLGLAGTPLDNANASPNAGKTRLAEFYADPADQAYILARFKADFACFGYPERL